MKKFSKIIALMLVLACALSLVACSSYGKIEKAFTKNGYTVSQDLDAATKAVQKELEQKDLAVTFHALTKVDGLKSTIVFVVEFKATEEMVKYVKESNTLQGAIKDTVKNEDVNACYNALVDAGFANGNCLVASLNLLAFNEVTNIVKNA